MTSPGPSAQAPWRARARAARLHAAGLTAVAGSLAAGWFELTRALAGNSLSWSYTVEWPLIAAYVLYIWARVARERSQSAHAQPDAREPAAEPADAGLLAWQDYLAKQHAADPPGGPPQR